MAAELRILFLADSHLGFDLPVRPRVERRRRGHDFLANHALALQPALNGEVDLVVHGGDVFDRPRIPASLAHQAYRPLVQVAERGVPVFVVPGNHERSVLPHLHLARHPHLHVFDRPRTIVLEMRGVRIALGGFPYQRRNVRTAFPELLNRTGLLRHPADIRVLCMHHCVEGATVGPGNFTFTSASDVIRCADLPAQCAVVLSGHIHRAQALTKDLRRRPLDTPVLYPGSIERTSVAEADEPKGYIIVTVSANESGGVARWEWRPLYARPMIVCELDAAANLEDALLATIRSAPVDAVVRVRVAGDLRAGQLEVLSAANLRSMAPRSMNVELVLRRAW